MGASVTRMKRAVGRNRMTETGIALTGAGLVRVGLPLDAFEFAGRRPLQNQQQEKKRDREQHRVSHLLRQNGDLTYEQIAEMHNCPVGTVKTQMRSALQKLRKLLTSTAVKEEGV